MRRQFKLSVVQRYFKAFNARKLFIGQMNTGRLVAHRQVFGVASVCQVWLASGYGSIG